MRQGDVERIPGIDVDVADRPIPVGQVLEQLNRFGYPVEDLGLANRPENVAGRIVQIRHDDRVPGVDGEVQRRTRFSNLANTLEEISGRLIFVEEPEGVLFGLGSVIPIEGVQSLDTDAGGDNGLPV